MADQGILAQSKPAAGTDTVLYAPKIGRSASVVLNVANDGSASAYSVAIKEYDQKLTLGASTYKLHTGDVITNYRVAVNTAMGLQSGFTPGLSITTNDGEKTFRFENFYVPDFTSVFVKAINIRQITYESLSGSFGVGETISTGTSPNDTTAVVYGVAESIIYVGPSTINGTGAEFAAGDAIASTGGAGATISSGGIGTAAGDFVFSTTTAGGTYSLYFNGGVTLFSDRTYRFDTSDASMSGRDFKLSTTINGEFGPDGTAGNGDDGTEYTTGKTTNGTAGSGGAYSQYVLAGNSPASQLYFYDGGTGTAGNSVYGGDNRYVTTSTNYEYNEFFIYAKEGTIVNSTDTFQVGAVTYTITGQTAGPYGYVRDYSGSVLKVIKGINSADFTTSDTFRDCPISSSASRTLATISSVDVATAAVEASDYIAVGKANGANNVDKITSIVIGGGERLVVNSVAQNNVFSVIGFEDASNAITARVFGGGGGGD